MTRYLYDGANLIGEYDASSNVPLRRYVFGAGTDEPLARYTGGGATPEWLLADHQGSVIATLNSSGAVTSKNTYEHSVPASYINSYRSLRVEGFVRQPAGGAIDCLVSR